MTGRANQIWLSGKPMTRYKDRYLRLAEAAQAFLVAYMRGADTDHGVLDRLKAALQEPEESMIPSDQLTPEQIAYAQAADARDSWRDIKRRVRRLTAPNGSIGRHALEAMCGDFGYVYETVAKRYEEYLIDD